MPTLYLTLTSLTLFIFAAFLTGYLLSLVLNARVTNTNLEKRVAKRTAQLADTTAYLDSILRSATDYAVVAVDARLHVAYLNPLAESLYDISANDALGKAINVIRAVDPQRFEAGLRHAEMHGSYEYRYIRETAVGLRHIAARFSPVVNKSGEIIGYAHFSQDVTEQKQTEAQLLTQQRALSALEERERIGRELHDGIGQVMGYLNLQLQVGRSLLDDGRQQAVHQLLEKLIKTTQTAHNDVREFILGMNYTELAATDFWVALERLAKTFEQERGFQVTLSLPADRPRWIVPPNDLHLLLIIQEALSNAYKHAGAARAQIIAQQIAPNQAQFIISDAGCGFDLQSVDSTTRDLHFGLNILRERTLELGGSLEIRSSPEQGTQVMITTSVAGAEETEAAVAIASAPANAPQRVLLVDDHPLFLEGLANLLKIYGITIVGTANNGLEAQKMARQMRPDLILMDVDMPICDGVEATRRITAEFPDQRIIMLSVAATDETLFAALKAGASGYLLKNMQAEELFMRIAGLDDGATSIAPELAGKMIAEFQRLTRPAIKLSNRQQQLLQAIADGRSYREAAHHLHVSERTIKREMREIMNALHLSSRAEAEEYARRKFQNGVSTTN